MRVVACTDAWCGIIGDGVEVVHRGCDAYLSASWSAEHIWILTEHAEDYRLLAVGAGGQEFRNFLVEVGCGADVLAVGDRVLIADEVMGCICEYTQRGRARPRRTYVPDGWMPRRLAAGAGRVLVLCERSDDLAVFDLDGRFVPVRGRGPCAGFAVDAAGGISFSTGGALVGLDGARVVLDNRHCAGLALSPDGAVAYGCCGDDEEPGCKLVTITPDWGWSERLLPGVQCVYRVRGADGVDLGHRAGEAVALPWAGAREKAA